MGRRPLGKVSLIDHVATMIAPVLIMLMVGSLVFFLIDVTQHGKFDGRLEYTFFFFVVAVVLIARISIELGAVKARLYGGILGLACFVAMNAFVVYTTPLFKVLGPIINLALMAVVWWSAHKLTWDCTYFDESAEASGRGVLAAVGLDNTKATTDTADRGEYDADRSRTTTKERKRSWQKPEAPEPVGWWARYRHYKEWRKKKPHTPGVWVLYFALGAIPLYALGQAMIPAEDARRAKCFWQMAVYIASALGLLMTTTLLGLKRYLEARNASVPATLTLAWLGLGSLLIVLFVGVAAVLPRPHSETPIFSFDNAKSNRKASQYAQVKDNSSGEGDGAKGQKKEAGDGNSNAKGGKAGGQGKGESKSGSGGQKQGNTSGNKQGEKSNAQNDQGKQGQKPQQNQQQQKGNDQSKQSGKQGEKSEEKSKEADGKENSGDAKDSGDNKADDAKPSETMQNITKVFEGVSNGLKWVIWIVIAIAVIVGGGYLLLKHMANFTGWAQGLLDWFRNLFGKKKSVKAATGQVDDVIAEAAQRPPEFDTFTNPFRTSAAEDRTAEELAVYTFAALQSWAYEHDNTHTPDETPREFVERLSEDYPQFAECGKKLAEMLNRAQYSTTPLPKGSKAMLAEFWSTLTGQPQREPA